MVVFHSVAVGASRRYVVVVVILETVVDAVDAVEAAWVIGGKTAAEGARQRHDSLGVAFEKPPFDVLLGRNSLVTTQLGDRRAGASHGHSRVGVRNRRWNFKFW